MKQSLILWIAAGVITFLAGFLQSRVSEKYPVSGSFGIDGKEISYKLDRVYSGKDNYKFLIQSETPVLIGKLYWRKHGSGKWNIIELNDSANVLIGEIPNQEPLTKIEYFVKLFSNEKEHTIPAEDKIVKLTFLGAVPAKINIYYWLTLLGGLFLAIRTGLEYFNIPGKMKKIEVFTLIFFVVNVFAFHPVKTSYELGAIGKTAIPITSMFQIASILLLITWIIATALIFNTKKYRIWAPVAALITIIIFELGNF
jgi:hypothetical protein